MRTPPRIRLSLHLAWGIASVLALAPLVSCTRESRRLDLVEVPTPPGGEITAMTRLDAGSESSLVAASHSHLYLRTRGESNWAKLSVAWPDAVKAPGRSAPAGLLPSSTSFNFPHATRLATHRGRIWMLTRPRSDRGPVLVEGGRDGENWRLAPLPSFYQRRSPTTRGGTSEGTALTQIDTRTPLRFADYGEDGLYLLDGHRVWRAQFSDSEPARLQSWARVDLSGLDPHKGTVGQTFPSVIRNYLPATEARPFELVTVFAERLYIYRRHRKSPRWLLVSTLPTIDRRLVGYEGTDLVYLVSPETLYRSTDRGERWTGLPLSRAVTGSTITTAAFLTPSETSEKREGPRRPGLPTVLIGTDAGSIYRSDYGSRNSDDVWVPVRSPDPDRRGITSIVSGRDAHVWASTAGSGVLTSSDGGRNWRRFSSELRATRPLDIAIGRRGALLLGTKAGLYRLTGAPEDGQWSRLHGRATSAVMRASNNGGIVSGTFDGSLVSEAADGPIVPERSKHVATGELPLFQPWSSPTFALPESAVLAIRDRPDSETMFAWSHQMGWLDSSNKGEAWAHRSLNSGLKSTLRDSVITNFLVGRGERLYLTSHPLSFADEPARLWHSSDDGETWRSMHTFPKVPPHAPFLLRRHSSYPDGTLYLGYGDRLARSRDAGENWSTLGGPWQTGRIHAYEVEKERQTIVYETPHASHLALLSKLRARRPESRTYQITWPNTSGLRHPDVRHVTRHQQFLYLSTSLRVFAGALPEGEVEIPNASAIIVILLSIFALVGLSFWYLRVETFD